MSSKTVASILFAVILGFTNMLASSAFAQNDASDDPAKDEALELERIRVTGYHLKRIDIEGPAPVVVFDRVELEASGAATLEEFIRYLPINFPAYVSPGSVIGQTSFDLRGIGTGATLTLVNGQRIAPYSWGYADIVDVNAIPVSAIERIEILKDGASAIYGADAIAGVVNIILRSDYDGIEVSVGYGVSEHGDGTEYMADLVTGKQFDRGGFMLVLSYFDREDIPRRAREWAADLDYTDLGGPNGRSGTGSPPTLLRYDSFFSGDYSNLFEHDPECGTNPLYSSVGPSPWGAAYGTGCKFNWAQFQSLLGGQQRLGFSLSGEYRLDSGTTFYGDFFLTDVEAWNEQAATPVQGSPAVPTIFGLPYVPANNPYNPFDTDGELLYRPQDLGNRKYRSYANSYRLSLGAEGTLGAWDWKTTLVSSKNEVDLDGRNEMRQTDFQLALLGMGGESGDMWYNPFGFEPQNDPELIEWLRVNTKVRNTSYDHSAELLVSRLFGELPGGSIGLAIGAQYREQELDQWASDDWLTNDLAGGTSYSPISADRSLFSAYVELSLPVHHTLEAQLAVRYEDYSDFGDTSNPKIALRWQPTSWIMLRASWTTSFLAPDFWQLYAPATPSLYNLEDTVRCEYTGLPEDCDIRSYSGTHGGNPDLQPEDGESWFAGLVWQPDFLPGFEFQVDLWSFEHQERIEWLYPQLSLDLGWDLGITREPTEPDGTPGRIISIDEKPWNIEQFETNGFDTTIRYSWDTEKAGNFAATLMHTYIDRFVWGGSSSWGSDNYAGKDAWVPTPRNRFNLNLSWDNKSHQAALGVHYLGHFEAIFDNVWVNGERTDDHWDVPGQTSFDLQYTYTFENLRNAKLRIGCINCGGETPPLKVTPTTFANYGWMTPHVDLRGRYYYLRWQQPLR